MLQKVRPLFVPAAWPSWIIFLYRGFEGLQDVDFAVGKKDFVVDFFNSGWAIGIAILWLFAIQLGVPSRIRALVGHPGSSATESPSATRVGQPIATVIPPRPLLTILREMEKNGQAQLKTLEGHMPRGGAEIFLWYGYDAEYREWTKAITTVLRGFKETFKANAFTQASGFSLYAFSLNVIEDDEKKRQAIGTVGHALRSLRLIIDELDRE